MIYHQCTGSCCTEQQEETAVRSADQSIVTGSFQDAGHATRGVELF
ncbi:hypothetical protein M1466_00750 [Candidatus Dependentiae bacterium]|nr:hypothetical protein [Candidatus Dependentiae bacterium]